MKLGTLTVSGGEKTKIITVVDVKSALCLSDQLRGRTCGMILSSVELLQGSPTSWQFTGTVSIFEFSSIFPACSLYLAHLERKQTRFRLVWCDEKLLSSKTFTPNVLQSVCLSIYIHM